MEQKEIALESTWKNILKPEFEKPYFIALKHFLRTEKSTYTVYPPGNQIFAAFNRTPFDQVKVVIIGQDPYHGPGQANGLCFSVSPGIAKPPSLLNIFKEIQQDLGFPIPVSGNLEAWADQGVLLLNASLTVRAHQAGSHQKKGWETFTDAVIRAVSEQGDRVVFLLWGNFAQGKAELINQEKHLVLKAAHPSPLARGAFFGCKHFSKTNAYLEETGKTPINWQLS